MAGDGELLGVDFLCDGQRKFAPFLIAFLLVGRYGIVDLRLHAIVCQIALQFIAMLAENGEDVMH